MGEEEDIVVCCLLCVLLVDGCVEETGEKKIRKGKGNVGDNGRLGLPGRTQAIDYSKSSTVLVDGCVE